ncbi:cytochrome P450 [Streptomyces tendae]|uniref:cytochrome P450 n=1 Tax=Streptomyces tendae TaxID=1932 RepID=UPI0038372DDE
MTAVHEFPMTRTCPFAPPAVYEKIREEQPVLQVRLPGGRQAWVVSRHEDVRTVLSDRRFSADRLDPRFPHLVEGGTGFRQQDERTMNSMDGLEHGQARRAVLGEFTARRLEALRPRIQRIVDERIDALLTGPNPGDLVTTVSLPVPSLVICEMLGVPYTDHDFFETHTTKLVEFSTTPEDRRASLEAIRGYMVDLIAAKEQEPSDDLLGRQIVKLREGGTYRRETLAELGLLLLAAGHETTANMISLSVVAFLRDPEQLALIQADPGKTLDAVEEMLRYWSIVDAATDRLCVEDVEIGGQRIRAGEGVLALSYSANRDRRAFSDPDELDITRGARHHVAFGFGPHQCLGQNLARMELQTVFDTLFRRVPTLELAADVNELSFKESADVYGLYRLPVTW